MSTTTIIVVVILLGAIMVIGLMWYKQKQETNAVNGVISLGTKIASALL